MADKTELQYTAEHEWVLVEGSTATVGITAYAADKLGDVVFVDLPEVGSDAAIGTVVGVLESNEAVVDSPELVNSDPFGEGWLIKVTFDELPPLLSYDEYTALVGE
jgi:glycine cleavage system H protein